MEVGARRALVVDDSRATRALLRRLLASFGFDVAEAGDGLEALHRLDADVPDVVLVDWNMPVMDGLAFIKAVRAQQALERLLVLMVTSEGDPAHVARALIAGADEYATKPLTRETLAEKLELIGLAA